MVGNAGRTTRSFLSKKVTYRAGGGFGRATEVASRAIHDSRKRRLESFKMRVDQLSNLSFEDRDTLHELEARAIAAGTSEDWGDIDMLPPGEEVMFLSNAGGEDDLCHELFEDRELVVGNIKRYDGRNRRDRTEVRNAQWSAQLRGIARAYMQWRAEGPPGSVPVCDDDTDAIAEYQAWSVHLVDFFDTRDETVTTSAEHVLINEALARKGYLSSAPIRPTVAISLKVLEAYRQLHRVCPRFSRQAQVRALCYLHSVAFSRTLVNQFNIAYDLYLEIIYLINNDVDSALHRDTPNYRMLNACAPCLHTLEGETPLKYSLLVTIDGNSSLKLVDDKFRHGDSLTDSRTRRTDIWLSADEVDAWKDEVVLSRQTQPAQMASSAGPSSVPPPSADIDEDATRAVENIAHAGDKGSASVCEDRWRNAGPEARKKMFALFAVTGVFVALCRHGQLLIMCDMIRSGELMKYPLAIVKKLLDVYPPGTKLAYDIACAFFKLLQRSRLAGDMLAKNLTGVVPAFHGHSHNRGCQVYWHPRYMEGVGKEDFEGCERLFSESNALAPGTRLSSPFHRHQAIEEFFGFWSEQKHVESAKFISNNYKQALQIIAANTPPLQLFMREHKVTEAVFQQYLEDERAYLASLKSRPIEDTLKVEYVEALLKLEAAGMRVRVAEAAADALENVPPPADPESAQKTARKRNAARATCRVARETFDIILSDVGQRELEMAVETRWVPRSPEYEDAIAALNRRQYDRALDRLELLVVQRLFELEKIGMSGTGYNMREKIGKALKARAEAIKKALLDYNRCAVALTPPRAPLEWQNIMEMASLAEFDLLRDSRDDVREQPWARPSHRRATNQYFDVLRAREEIDRLNHEVPRLLTAILDEHVDFWRAVASRMITDPLLARELSARWVYRDRINCALAARLYRLSLLPGFSGRLQVGDRVGQDSQARAGVPLPSWAISVAGGASSHRASTPSASDDDEPVVESGVSGVATDEEALRLVDFIDNVS